MVYDVDNKVHVDDTRRHDLIGEMECTLADIVTGGQLYKRTLRMKGMYVTPCVLTLTPHLSDHSFPLHHYLGASVKLTFTVTLLQM